MHKLQTSEDLVLMSEVNTKVLELCREEIDQPSSRDIGAVEIFPSTEITSLLGLEEAWINHIPPELFADQLAWLENNILSKVTPEELIDKAWTRTDSIIRAPNMTTATNFFNRVTSIVRSTIMLCSSMIDRKDDQEHIPSRKDAIMYFIRVCERCKKIRNYDGCMQMICALHSHPITSLEDWSYVPKKHIRSFDAISRMMSPSSNYNEYRISVSSLGKEEFVVPYIGLALQGIIFAEDGNPDTTGEEGLLNMYKVTLIQGIIVDIISKFRSPVSVRPEYTVQSFILMFRPICESELSKLK